MNYEEIEELVDRAKKKDEEAQAELIRQTYKKAYFIAYSMVQDEELAKDLLQESYIKAFAKLDQLKDSKKFQGWLNRIVNNKTIDYFRMHKEKPRTVLFSALSNDEDGLVYEENIEDETITFKPDENMNYQMLKDGLYAVMKELPEKQRMALMMHYFEQMSVQEIADDFGMGVNTVKSYLAYGRKKIKTCIEEMRKKGTSFYGVAPIPFLVWMLETDSQAVSTNVVKEVVTGVVGAGSTAGIVSAAEGGSKGGSAFSKWWASKTTAAKTAMCVTATATVGGTYAIIPAHATWNNYQDYKAFEVFWLDGVEIYAFGQREQFDVTYNKINKQISDVVITFSNDAESIRKAQEKNINEGIDADVLFMSVHVANNTIDGMSKNCIKPDYTINENDGSYHIVQEFDLEKTEDIEYIKKLFYFIPMYNEAENKFYYDEKAMIESINNAFSNSPMNKLRRVN